MKTLTVDLGARSYPIHVGPGLLDRAELLHPHLAGGQVMVVTNETVAPLYLERVRGALHGLEVHALVVPDGERFKTLETLSRIFDALLEAGFGRDCTVLALGGGVVGDVAGLAAACYQRGVACVQAPTTLLAQVDSSVGGKTAVNHPRGKNMIGVFHQPVCVLADTRTLDTLPDRELRAGVAEVLKYGVLGDVEFFARLETTIEALLAREPRVLTEVIERSCRIKAEVVATDEREGGRRALLNLGHTFGHAIEAGVGYGEWLHGEAVAAGICLAADLSRRLGRLSTAECERITALVARARLPTLAPPELEPARMLELMRLDKKVQEGRLRLVLLDGIGRAVVTDDFEHEALVDTLGAGRAAA